MTAARNDVTGDALVSKKTNDAFREGWDRIFGKKKAPEPGCTKHESNDPCKYCAAEEVMGVELHGDHRDLLAPASDKMSKHSRVRRLLKKAP